ncbi:hypothetical protein DRO26_02880 [Candidatus Bathyarchaeota archaeon]|nr:MAG: hypothetical protein DRO26_02880 [Candidatus Bathyarchaeota archaeon]
MGKTWNPVPLQHRVIETLKSMGSCDDTELLRVLKKEVDINMPMLNKVLLQLEIRGLICVYNTTKDKRKIELRKR